MTPNPKSILEKANARMSAGDIEGFLAYCTDDTEWIFIGDRTLKGKQAVREYLAAAYGAPPRFHVDDYVAEGDLLTAVGEITITAPGGKSTHYHYCDVWRLRGDKLHQLRAYVVEGGHE